MTTSEKFKEATDNFQMWLGVLISTVEGTIPQAQKVLDEKTKSISGYSPESDAELILRDISKRLDDVNSSFNNILKSISML